MLNKKTQLQYLLGEKQDRILLAARYIDACHKRGRSQQISDAPTNTHARTHTHHTKFLIVHRILEFVELIC